MHVQFDLLYSSALSDGYSTLIVSSAYNDSNRHFVESSSGQSKIALIPNDVSDVQSIMNIIAKYKIPFAVKGGGHAMNPDFSSTTGVQIYMSRFNRIRYHEDTELVDIGAGCVWDEVYRDMSKIGRNIVGGASSQGVGVAGYLLGGGFSLKTNRFGLGIDNVAAIQIVLPNGEVHNGGGNNFGIVTRFTLKTHVQGNTWGAPLTFKGQHEEAVKGAIANFVAQERRPEAAIVAAFRYRLEQGKADPQHSISVLCVFDGRKPDKDPFERFRAITKDAEKMGEDPAGWNRSKKVSERKKGEDWLHEVKCYADVNMMASHHHAFDPSKLPGDGQKKMTPSQSRWAMLGTDNARGRFGCIMVSNFTRPLIDAVAEQARIASESLKPRNGRLVLVDIWPFLQTAYDSSPPGWTAWPHKKGKVFGPLLAYFLWDKAEDDDFWVKKMERILKNLRTVALREGCTTNDAPVYSNCALAENTTVEDVYKGNLERLKKLRRKYDPDDVMRGAGGFRIPLADDDDADLSSDSEVSKVSQKPKRGKDKVPPPKEPAQDSQVPLRLEGFYTYYDPRMNGQDDGYMNFSLLHNPGSSVIHGSGTDNAGGFTIQGMFDGQQVRFTKRYSGGWEWHYSGAAMSNGQGGVCFTGVWGQGNAPYGAFVLLANPSKGKSISSKAARTIISQSNDFRQTIPWGYA
ncbi:hypothetical protein FRB99_007994 [Tulasnella sp. 403]|nr:hypothetical protein FRB99_007994 [Tulasnella sp. 403]